LTTNPAADIHPVWTFDGVNVMFSSNRTGDVELYVVDAQGEQTRRLTERQGTESQPNCRWGG
jgi:Tol biopolymer transport system component